MRVRSSGLSNQQIDMASIDMVDTFLFCPDFVIALAIYLPCRTTSDSPVCDKIGAAQCNVGGLRSAYILSANYSLASPGESKGNEEDLAEYSIGYGVGLTGYE